MEKRTVIVTGGNSGLGYQCAKNIAMQDKNYTLVLACRNPEKAARAIQDMKEETGNENIHAAIEKDGDTTVKINGIVYYNTKKAIPVEPDESVIVNEELPLDGSMTDVKITAYAFINEEQLGDILVCLIDGEWYQFIATDRAGQP